MFIRLPPLRALQVFEAVGRLGSVTAAARDLNVSAGAVSQHIHALEKDVGVALFERHGRKLVITSWGKIYLERVTVGFDHLRSANKVLQRARLRSGIVVSAPPSLTIRWLRPQMIEWQKLCSDVNLRLIGEDNEPNFAEQQVDFRISYGAARFRYEHFTEIFVDWVVPVCSPRFLERRLSWTPADILEGPLIGTDWDNPDQSPPTWSNWANHVGLEAPERPCELSFSLSSAAIDAAINDGGFALAQISMISDDLVARKLVAASNQWLQLSEPYALAWNPASLDRPSVLEFRNFLVRAGRRLKAMSVPNLFPQHQSDP